MNYLMNNIKRDVSERCVIISYGIDPENSLMPIGKMKNEELSRYISE